MHTLHTIIILNLELRECVKILKFILLFLHKILLASMFCYAYIFFGLEKIILISPL
jgi:hypothetical protein